MASGLSTAIEGYEDTLPANDLVEEPGRSLSCCGGSLAVDSCDCSLSSLNCSLWGFLMGLLLASTALLTPGALTVVEWGSAVRVALAMFDSSELPRFSTLRKNSENEEWWLRDIFVENNGSFRYAVVLMGLCRRRFSGGARRGSIKG